MEGFQRFFNGFSTDFNGFLAFSTVFEGFQLILWGFFMGFGLVFIDDGGAWVPGPGFVGVAIKLGDRTPTRRNWDLSPTEFRVVWLTTRKLHLVRDLSKSRTIHLGGKYKKMH